MNHFCLTFDVAMLTKNRLAYRKALIEKQHFRNKLNIYLKITTIRKIIKKSLTRIVKTNVNIL